MYYRDLQKLGFDISVGFYSYAEKQGIFYNIRIDFDANIFFKHSLRDIKEERFKDLDSRLRAYFMSLDSNYAKYLIKQTTHAYGMHDSNTKEFVCYGITPELKDFVKEIYFIIKEDIENGNKN